MGDFNKPPKSAKSSISELTKVGGKGENVRVVVRCRPLSQAESEINCEEIVLIEDAKCSLTVFNPNGGASEEPKSFTFDNIFPPDSVQADVYNEVARPIVENVLEGYNGTIFAYGQTGTGKTFTMEGVYNVPELKGIIPNSFAQIFAHIGKAEDQCFLVRCSYLEIYNEEVRDLLSKSASPKLEVKENKDKGVYVKGLSSYLVRNAEDMDSIMSTGNRNRSVASTKMNSVSSRSHAIFTITVECSMEHKRSVRVGKLNLVDLAGSERLSKTGATGERLKEATKINLSLSSLGNVISALVDGASHVPYRDSKLTRLLQDSLGGNSRTIMIATVGLSGFNYDETINTLRYASRAKNIKNKPRINENPKDAILRQYQDEITRLKKQIEDKQYNRQSNSNESNHPNLKKSNNNDYDYEEASLSISTKKTNPSSIFETNFMNLMNSEQIQQQQQQKQQEEDKESLLGKIQHASNEIDSIESEISTLNEEVQWLESKVLNSCGERKSFVELTEGQIQELKIKEKELEEHKRRQEELRKAMVQKQMTNDEALSTLNEVEEQFETKVEKINRIKKKIKKLNESQSLSKIEHLSNLEELKSCVAEMSKELRLKKMIVDNFVPRKYRKELDSRMRYDETDQIYFVEPKEPNNFKQDNYPLVDRMVLYPMFNQTRFKKLNPVSKTFYTNENLLLLSPELPTWKAKKFIQDVRKPKIENLIKGAMKELKNILIINCDHKRKLRHPPQDPPEYIEIGSNILLRTLNTEKFIDFSQVPSHFNIPMGNKITNIQIPRRNGINRKLSQTELLALPLANIIGEIAFPQLSMERTLESNLPSSRPTSKMIKQQMLANMDFQDPSSIYQPPVLACNPIFHPHSRPSTAKTASRAPTASRAHKPTSSPVPEEWIVQNEVDFEVDEIEREILQDSFNSINLSQEGYINNSLLTQKIPLSSRLLASSGFENSAMPKSTGSNLTNLSNIHSTRNPQEKAYFQNQHDYLMAAGLQSKSRRQANQPISSKPKSKANTFDELKHLSGQYEKLFREAESEEKQNNIQCQSKPLLYQNRPTTSSSIFKSPGIVEFENELYKSEKICEKQLHQAKPIPIPRLQSNSNNACAATVSKSNNGKKTGEDICSDDDWNETASDVSDDSFTID